MKRGYIPLGLIVGTVALATTEPTKADDKADAKRVCSNECRRCERRSPTEAEKRTCRQMKRQCCIGSGARPGSDYTCTCQ